MGGQRRSERLLKISDPERFQKKRAVVDKSLQANGLVHILMVEPLETSERLIERDARQPVAIEQWLPRLLDLTRRRFTVPSHPDSPP